MVSCLYNALMNSCVLTWSWIKFVLIFNKTNLSKDKWIKCSTSRYAPVAILWLVLYTRVHYSQLLAAILDGKKKKKKKLYLYTRTLLYQLYISSHQTSRYWTWYTDQDMQATSSMYYTCRIFVPWKKKILHIVISTWQVKPKPHWYWTGLIFTYIK